MTSRKCESSDLAEVWRVRTSYWGRWRICSLLLVALALIIAGCGATVADSPGGTPPVGVSTEVSFADQAVPPMILRDPAPGLLDLSMSVTFDQASSDSTPMTEVGLAFLSGGHSVQFAGNEHGTCNGTALPLKGRVAVFQVLRLPTAQAVGTMIRCTYAAGGKTAGVTLQIPPAPAITSPRSGALVTRSTHTLVTYRYDPATGRMLGIVALAPSSPMGKAIAMMNTPGPLQATVDTSKFLPVTGLLALTMTLTPHITESGIPFHSVEAFGSATALVAVMWT